MKRAAAGAHLPTPWLFEPPKRPDDRTDYCLDCSFHPWYKHQLLSCHFFEVTYKLGPHIRPSVSNIYFIYLLLYYWAFYFRTPHGDTST